MISATIRIDMVDSDGDDATLTFELAADVGGYSPDVAQDLATRVNELAREHRRSLMPDE